MDKLDSVLAQIERMTEEVNVNAVFGTPQTVGDRVLIPVAEVMYGFGLGGGTAPQSGESCEAEDEAEAEGDHDACCCGCETSAGDEADADADTECGMSECQCMSASAEGAGGGGAAKARPLAVIEVTPEGVEILPIEDEQKIALAGILLGAWAVGWLGLVLTTLFRPRK